MTNREIQTLVDYLMITQRHQLETIFDENGIEADLHLLVDVELWLNNSLYALRDTRDRLANLRDAK